MDADAYQQYAREDATLLHQAPREPGRVLMPRRLCDDDRTEFTMITVWDGLESIIAFAGPDPDPGRVLPLDEQFLIERELSAALRRVQPIPARASVIEKPGSCDPCLHNDDPARRPRIVTQATIAPSGSSAPSRCSRGDSGQPGEAIGEEP
jgi:hypothetical protein